MAAADSPTTSPNPVQPARTRRSRAARVGAMFLPLFCLLTAGGIGAFARQPAKPVPPAAVPGGLGANGVRDAKNPDWSTDPSDPFPMPPEFANVELMKQTAADA